MFEAQIRGRFSAGHRLLQHSGKCRYPHGHSYQVEVLLRAEVLGGSDWIDDFGAMKQALADILETHFDHAFIIDSRDRELIGALSKVEPRKLYILEGQAPTAERIAAEIFRLLEPKVTALQAVRVWETEQQFASYIAR